MVRFCTNCGAMVPEGSGFCTQCGTKVLDQTPAGQPQKQPVQQAQQVPSTPPPVYPATPKVSSKTLMFAGVIVIAIVLIVVMFYVGFMMGSEQTGGSPQGTENYGVVMGRVADTGGSAISDVTVTANGQPVDTNDQGWFSISNVAEGDRVVVDFERDGYATTHRIIDVQSGESNFIDATMSQVDETGTFTGSSGGTITSDNGGSLTVGANDLEDSQGDLYTGNVQVSMTVFDPTDEEDASCFPGEYLGRDTSGNNVPIKSYGFMDIALTDSSGNEVQLADGENAIIRIPVPSSLQSEAATMGTCPMWYFDTDTSYWMEEGQGSYDSSTNSFVGSITHFSTWNFDVAYLRAYISGRVVNSAGTPVPGATVECWGPGWKYSRWASGETCTASDGTFTRIPVECTVIFKYKASKGGYDSATYTIPRALSCDEEYDVGDIVLGSVSSAQITLTWGANPSDLDSHLVVPAYGSNSTFHLYYTKSMDDGYDFSGGHPNVNLDTDDTTSYGPEVVTIFHFYPGTYRYCVRHYAGTGDIETSGAEINVIIQGVGIYRFTPPSGQTAGTDIWRVFDIVVDESGTITAVNTINDYVEGSDYSEYLYP